MGVFGRKKETASEMNAFLEFYLISWHMCMILVCNTTLLKIFFFIIIIWTFIIVNRSNVSKRSRFLNLISAYSGVSILHKVAIFSAISLLLISACSGVSILCKVAIFSAIFLLLISAYSGVSILCKVAIFSAIFLLMISACSGVSLVLSSDFLKLLFSLHLCFCWCNSWPCFSFSFLILFVSGDYTISYRFVLKIIS